MDDTPSVRILRYYYLRLAPAKRRKSGEREVADQLMEKLHDRKVYPFANRIIVSNNFTW